MLYGDSIFDWHLIPLLSLVIVIFISQHGLTTPQCPDLAPCPLPLAFNACIILLLRHALVFHPDLATSHSPFGFSATRRAQHLLAIRMPVSLAFQDPTQQYSAIPASPPPHSLVSPISLGSPRWLLSFAFALRPLISAPVIQQASGEILLHYCSCPSVDCLKERFICATIITDTCVCREHKSTRHKFMLIYPGSTDIAFKTDQIIL